MVFAYSRGRWVARVVGENALLAIALAVAAWSGGAWGAALAAGIVVTAAWGIATLHHPSRVELTPDAISFSAFGRTHVFAWSDVTRVRVRRFAVRDRVLVRITPASALRGRYWLTDALDGYDALVEELARRATS